MHSRSWAYRFVHKTQSFPMIDRRTLLASAVPVALASLARPRAALGGLAGRAAPSPQYYELRRYRLRNVSQQRAFHTFWGEVATPALNRLGIEPVGGFTVVHGPNAPSAYVLLPHPDLESAVGVRRRLAQDAAYTEAGAGFLKRSMADPSYARYESSLFKAFDGMPVLETPLDSDGRIFELRVYESPSDEAGIRKIEMFDNGEIPIFRETGLHPVFFGEALAGEQLPNLTYLLVFENMAAREEAWAEFIAHPDWKTMSADPYYAETVSAISSYILRPTPWSQV